MGTYDTIGGAPRHDPILDQGPPCNICGDDPDVCECVECPVCHEVGNPRCVRDHREKP